jgi:hypothetical protein
MCYTVPGSGQAAPVLVIVSGTLCSIQSPECSIQSPKFLAPTCPALRAIVAQIAASNVEGGRAKLASPLSNFCRGEKNKLGIGTVAYRASF